MSFARERRKKLIRVLREEGRRAFLAGRSIQACPFKWMDGMQWRTGYEQAERESRKEEPHEKPDAFPGAPVGTAES